MNNGDSIELTGAQARAVKLLIRSEVKAAIEAAFEKYARGGCLVQCERVAKLEEVVGGNPEEDKRGLLERTDRLEDITSGALKATWIAVSGIILAAVAFLVGLFGH